MYEMIGILGDPRTGGSGLGVLKIRDPMMVTRRFDLNVVNATNAVEENERAARIAEIEAKRQRQVDEEAARPVREAAAEQAAIQARAERQTATVLRGLVIGGAVVVTGGGLIIYRWLQKRKISEER